MNQQPKLDQTDLLIITQVLVDAKMSYSELGQSIFVSGGTVHVRLNKLQEYGIITGSTLKVNFRVLGYEVLAFVGIHLAKSSSYKQVIKILETIPEIVNARYYTIGEYSIFIQLMCTDSDHLREVLSNQIGLIEGIQRTETFLSLEEVIQRRPQVISDDLQTRCCCDCLFRIPFDSNHLLGFLRSESRKINKDRCSKCILCHTSVSKG